MLSKSLKKDKVLAKCSFGMGYKRISKLNPSLEMGKIMVPQQACQKIKADQ